MPTIISQNTTWKKGEVINMTTDFQIASGAILTIEAGTTINGNGNLLTVFGNVNFQGTETSHITTNNLNFSLSSNSNQVGNIQLNYVDVNNGNFLAANGYGMYGKFDITNSNFVSVDGFYIWYPTSPSTFVGNTFYKSSGLSIGTNGAGTVLVKNNSFTEQTTSYAIESWANYNSGIQVVNNSFLTTNKVALAVKDKYDSARLTAIDNYFGTSDLSIINSMILDQTDSLTYASIISTSHTDKPSTSTPKFDSTPPTIAISSTKTSLSYAQTAIITFSLSEPSTNFTESDVSVKGGKLSNFNGSGSIYTAIFTPELGSSNNGVVSVASSVFTDGSGNLNSDGSEVNNTLNIAKIITTTTEKHTLSVIVEKGVLGSSATLLKGLGEMITYTDGITTKHTVEYSGLTFDYSAIDSLITTVTRDDEFTTEFRKELTDFAPTAVNLSYKDAVLLIGLANIDTTLIALAGADGNFVG
jgi:hypothetical protein